MSNRDIEHVVRRIMSEQLFGVLATTGTRGPHSTIVSFAAADNLTSVVFATPRETRKFGNLQSADEVSFFVDDRTMEEGRLLNIHGVEARGVALEVAPDETERYRDIFLAKHPVLESFVREAALIIIRVHQFDVVHGFQNVLVFRPGGEA